MSCFCVFFEVKMIPKIDIEKCEHDVKNKHVFLCVFLAYFKAFKNMWLRLFRIIEIHAVLMFDQKM